MAKKKKNDALMQAAQTRVKNAAPQETSLGITQAQVDAVVNRRREATQNRQASRAAAAPVQTSSASDRLSAVARDRVSYETTGHSTYFDDQPRASERLRNNSSSASYANDRAPRFDYGRNDTQLRRRSNQGAGKLKTTYDGDTARYQYERDPRNDSLNASYSHMAAENGTWQQRRNSPLMGKLTDRLGVDRSSQYMTQETDRTVKYDDGRKTEYFVVDGKGDDARLISVPEERYFQQQQLDGGLNPETMTPYKRLQGAAEHGIKNALHGLKSTYGSIQSNKNDQQRAKEYAETHPNGSNLNRRRDMLMGSYGAAGAVRGGDDVKANEYVNQEAMEDIMREREQLEQQKKLDEMYQAYKAGASKPMQLAMDVTDTTANMAPGMLSNFLLPGSYIPEMAVQAYGNSYNQARINGATHDEAILSGIQNAAVESLSESLFAGGRFLGKATGVKGIFRPGKAIEDATLPFIRSTAGKDVVRTVQKLGLAGTEEGAEELVAGIAEPVLDALIYQGGIDTLKDPDFWTSTVHDALYNGLVGFASGGGFGAVDVAQSIQQGADIRAHADVANMINQGLAMPEDSKVYQIAKKLDVQYKAGESLGNLDVSDLSKAMQEQRSENQKKYNDKMRSVSRSLAAQGVVESNEDYDFYRGDVEKDYAEGNISKEEYDYHVSHPLYKGVSFYDDAIKQLTEKTGQTEEEVAPVANSIARIFTGQANEEDLTRFSMINTAAREAFEEVSERATGRRITLPASNSATFDTLNNINADSRTVYAKLQNEADKDKSRARKVGKVLSDARVILGKDNKDANDAFREAIQSIPTEDLDAAREEFTFLWSLGGNANLADRSDLREIRVLPLEVQQKAVELGRETVDARYDEDTKRLKEAQEAKDVKEGTGKPDAKHNDIQQKLNDEEKKNVAKTGMRRVLSKFQKARGVRIVLESNRTLEELDKQVGNEPLSDYSGVNGWYSNGEIHINIDGVDPWSATLSHEFTHHLEKYSPSEYKKLIDFIKEEKTKNNPEAWQQMINERMARYASAGKPLSDPDAAVREIVADMAAEFMNDEATVRRLFGYDESLARSIMHRLLAVISDMLNALKDAATFRGTQWEGMEDQLKKARQMWLDAAEEARKNADLDIESDGVQLMLTIIGGKGVDEPSIREQVESAKAELDELPVIPFESIDTSNMSPDEYVKAVHELWKKYGKYIDTLNYGAVELDNESLIRDGFNHIEHDVESQSAFPVVPKVIKRGIQIAYVTNHDGRGYDTMTIGARVGSEEDPKYMAVVLRKTKGTRYYMHSVVMPDGTEVVVDSSQEKNKRRISPGSIRKADGDPGTTLVSDNTLSDEEDSRNQNTQKEQGPFSLAATDSTGRQLTKGQREYFKDSKIRDEQGRLKVMYHGTNNEFTVFDFSQGGKNGTAEGYGIYTSDREDVSRHYGGRLIEGYVNITRPAASDQKTIKRSELKKLIKATVDAEAQRLAEDYDGDVAAAAKDTWISNYTYTYDKSLDAAIDEVAGTILDLNDNDMDIVQEVMGGMAIRDYNEAEQFYDVLTDVTGIDGFVTDWEDSNTGESSRIALAFRSNQIKNVTNESPTEDPDIRYSISTPMSELDHTDKTVADSNGDPVAKFDRAGGVQFSISTYEDKGRAVLNKYLDKMVLEGEMDQDEADQIRTEMEKIYDVCKDYADTGRYLPFTAWSNAEVITGANGRPIFSAVKNNSEYKMNMDFSTICKKRRTLDAIFNELVNRGFFDRFDLNKEDSAAFVVKMNDIIRKNGFEAACALCFVEARRYRQQQTAMTFRDMWNDLVKSMYKDESKISHFNFGQDDTARMVEDGIHTMKDSDLDLTYLKKVAKSKGVPSRAAKLLLEDPSQRKLMRTGDMMSSVGFENFQVQNPKLMKIYNAKKGTGGAKSSFGDVQYFHEIIGSRNKTFSRNKAYKVGGVRIQSFSDYVPRMVFDYVEMVADLAAKRLPAHAYTKEALFAKQFGLTGIKINLSLVPDVVKGGKAVGLDKNGNYVWNVEGTFPYDEAEKLIHAEGYKENVGTIAVGVSDEQIRKMLADPNIMMVIPYHKSSLNPIVAEMTNVDAFTDYTDFQNTKDEEGKAVKRDFDWDGKLHKLSHGKDGKLLPKEQWGDIQSVVKEYADWCKARNYTPKFSQFLYMEDGSINPGYYKMLEDFSLLTVDGEFTPQDDVRMKFPTESDAFGSMADLIAEGLDADAVLEGKRSKKVAPIADEIEALAESGELLSDLNQRDVDVVKNFMETTDVTKGHQPQFSLASDRDREIADLQSKVERLQRDKRRTYGREASDADARRVARALLADTSSDFSLNQTIKAVKELFTMIKRGDDFADIYGYVQGIARSIADSSYDMVEIPGASELADLRQRFLDARKSQGGSPLKILIPQNLIGDFDRVGGWKEFRAAHKGIVTLSVNSGESYDSFIEGIADEFGEQFNVDGDNSGIDTLINIIEAADSQEARHPVRKAYKDEDVEGVMPDDVDMGIMGGYRDTEVNEIIDRLLDDVADQIAPDLTFADKKAAEKDAAVKKERAKWEARREQWRKDRDKRIAEMKEDKKLAVEAQRAKGKERLQKQAELYRRQREKARERRADNASRRKTLDRIYKTTQRLSQKLLKPTDSQHIPEKYRKAVADMLGWLDFENARTDQWAKRHGNVPSARILNMRKLQEVYAKIAEDEQLNQYIEPDDQIYEWLEYLSDIEGSRLDDLTTEQLRTVRLVLDAVSWQVNNADKALTEGLKQSRADMATELMDELEAQKDEKFSDGTFKKFIKADSTPVHFFERLGLNTLKKLYQQLTLAQDTHIKHLSEAQEYIEKNITSKWGNTAKVGNNSLIKKWTEESEKYELENGKTVEMTGAQVMSLYALNKREQARKHLLGGGIVIAPTKVKRNLKGGIKEYMLDRQLQKTRAELTYADITKILGKMSQEQIDAAEAMLKYLKTTSEWGNETSMKLYGYRKFTEDNYFPIQSAKEFIAGSNLELQRDKKIKNQGMTKNVNEYANNPIVIDDFFEVTTAHINQMSQYNSFVPILEDFDRIYQYSEYDPETQKYHRSVKELIEQKHGRWAADYIENLLKNVNGNYGNEVADIQGFEKLLRNWKAAKIGLSVRVLAQQPTAVVRAFNEIDPKYFVGTPKRGSHKRMWEICPIAEWKHWGYSQTDIHRSMRDTMMGDKHLSDKLFFDIYGKADDLGWGAIFDAVERETKDLMKKGKLKFEYDSAEYRQHVNERFRHIVDRTQVVDSVLHRSQLMRSQNTLTKAMTAFMAEPTISVNTIMTAFTRAQEEARAGHKAAAAKAASRGVGVFVANAVAVSLMASLISAIRESYLPDDDDDDEEKELSRLQQMMVNMGFEEGSFLYDWISGYFIEDFKDNINPLMMIPVAKDMLNMWQGYEAPNPMYQLPQSLIQTTQNMKKWIDEDGDTRYSGRYYIERAAESVAELFGVPAANIRKELIGIQNIYFRAISEKEYGDYLQDRWELNEDYKSNKNIFIDHYLNAKKAGHDESAKDIREQLLKSKVRDDEGNLVFTDEAIQKRAWSVYAPNFKDDVIAGRDVSKQEKDLKSVGITAEDIDDKKSKALVSSISDAVEMGDTDRLEDLYGVLEKYGYGEYDVDKKVKSAASDLMYDAIDAENYDEADRYINVITDVTGYTRDDVVSSITTHYMSSYYEAMDAGDQSGASRVTNILGKYGVSSNTIREKEAEHYKDYYRQKAYMAYSSGNTAEAYRIATEYNQKYPGVYSKGVDGMIYGIQNLSDDTIRRYTTSGKYDEWQLP